MSKASNIILITAVMIITACGSFTPYVVAQEASGIVRGCITVNSVPQAGVQVNGFGLSATTGTDGYYDLGQIANGAVGTITATYNGYSTDSGELTLQDPPYDDVNMNIIMPMVTPTLTPSSEPMPTPPLIPTPTPTPAATPDPTITPTPSATSKPAGGYSLPSGTVTWPPSDISWAITHQAAVDNNTTVQPSLQTDTMPSGNLTDAGLLEECTPAPTPGVETPSWRPNTSPKTTAASPGLPVDIPLFALIVACAAYVGFVAYSIIRKG